jgi:hypothetical protein
MVLMCCVDVSLPPVDLSTAAPARRSPVPRPQTRSPPTWTPPSQAPPPRVQTPPTRVQTPPTTASTHQRLDANEESAGKYVKAIVNRQYNTPKGLYSSTAAEETFSKQSSVILKDMQR